MLVAPVIEEGKLRAIYRPAGRVVFVIALTIAALAGSGVSSRGGSAAAADSLVLQQPDSFRVWSVYNPNRRQFVVWMTFKNPPDSVATYLHAPDTTGWSVGLPTGTVSTPQVGGTYIGDVDRTFRFVASDSAQVGVGRATDGRLRLEFEIRGEEWYSGRLNVGSSYTPGTYQQVLFDDTRTAGTTERIYFGIDVAFTNGVIGVGREFRVGMEDFEGFHMWRGIEPDGSDLTVIGEVSKQEAFRSGGPGGEFADSVYFYQIIPDLRQNGIWYSPYGALQCLGTQIDLPLAGDDMFWFDCNAFNGFTYYYTVTTFDRGYSVASGRQGLAKIDNCNPTEGVPYECADQLRSISMEVNAQNEMYRIYVVPNPYRTGGSRLTSENYHNFPDDKVRFVNLPTNSDLKVYTMAGDLVWEYYHTGPLGNVDWDTANLSGELITSGVYIFRVESSTGDSMYGRFVVIR